jgi:hypothetical protein
LFVSYCVGNAAGAQIFQSKDAPLYQNALIISAIMYGTEFLLLICWRFYYVWQNKRRDAKVAELGMTPEESALQGRINAENDMTDWANIHFRWVTDASPVSYQRSPRKIHTVIDLSLHNHNLQRTRSFVVVNSLGFGPL